MASTPTGVEVPAGGDPFDPQGDMVTLANSLRSRIVVPVPNTAARTALLTAIDWAPSTLEPLRVRQGDTGDYWEHDGSSAGWRRTGGARQDGTFTYSAGYKAGGDALKAYRRGPVGYLAGVLTISEAFGGGFNIAQEYTFATGLTAALRPTEAVVMPATAKLGAIYCPAWVRILPNGEMKYALGAGTSASVPAEQMWVMVRHPYDVA